MRYSLPGLSILAFAAALPAMAQNDGSFALGRIEEILITARRVDAGRISASVLDANDIYRFKALTLDTALNLIPGASSSNTGGSRNERLLFVRGFDRFQVPLSIDGIRVYLPADNRLDAGFFLTSDLAEIQVQKGYVSVLDGPGGLGGAINLVTRRPGQTFEADGRIGTTFGRSGSSNASNVSVSAGSRQDKYYLQASGALTDVLRTELPNSFTATANENGGFRDYSSRENTRINAKVGLTPNETDEYTVSYTSQSGEKEAPLHVTDPIASQRYWTWPYWDIDSLYFLSTTSLSSDIRLKAKGYYNTFKNALFSFDNTGFVSQTLPRSFRSYYDDKAYGGSMLLEADIGASNTLKAAVHYRRDDHVEFQTVYSPRTFTEPEQSTVEDTWSFALENRFRITPQFDLLAGVSYDLRDLKRAEDYITPTTTAPGSRVIYAISDSPAWNQQAALIYSFNESDSVYANISNRTRFPTIFDRFSSRFGGAVSNPTLKPERTLNLEVGTKQALNEGIRIDAAVFYSDLNDVIVSVPFVFQGTNVTQSRNVGDAEYYGLEGSVDAQLSETISTGLRYTYTKREIENPAVANFQLTGVPNHQVFVFLGYEALANLKVTPSVQLASKRWTVTTNGATYYRTGSYLLANLDAAYQLTANAELSIGVKNLFDDRYTLVDGFPEEGRTLQINLRTRF